MSNEIVNCYILPSSPLPMLLPVDCVAEIVAQPSIQLLAKAQAKWMKGHVSWQNQRLPVMSYADLLDSKLSSEPNGKLNSKQTKSSKNKDHLVVLNAIPSAARKAYSALLCDGEVEQVEIDDSVDYVELPQGIDKRYVDAVLSFGGKQFIVPKLASLAVAFTYI